MEKRAFVRYPGQIKVILYSATLPLAVCRTENLGPDGMYVHSKSGTFEKGTRIEVEFENSAQQEQKRYRIPAKIVFTDESGMGLRFISSSLFSHKLSRMMLGTILFEQPTFHAAPEPQDSKEVA